MDRRHLPCFNSVTATRNTALELIGTAEPDFEEPRHALTTMATGSPFKRYAHAARRD